MRVSMGFLQLILLFLFLISFNVGRSSCCSSNLIEESCKNFTQVEPHLRYKFCRDSLEAAPGSRCANRRELGLITLKLLLDNATDTQSYIKQLLGKKGLNPILNSSLADCFDMYSEGLFNLKNGISAYESGVYSEAIFGVSAISWSGVRCKDTMKGNKGDAVLPLKKRNNDIIHLSSIGFGFTS